MTALPPVSGPLVLHVTTVSCRFRCQPYQREFPEKILLKEDGSLGAETRLLDTFNRKKTVKLPRMSFTFQK